MKTEFTESETERRSCWDEAKAKNFRKVQENNLRDEASDWPWKILKWAEVTRDEIFNACWREKMKGRKGKWNL